MLNIQDKVILITGASSGIGEACARLLAEKGARLLLGARRTERLEQLVGEIRAAGGNADYRRLDVTSQADTQVFVDAALAQYGRVDVLINNAG
ncbi:MAG TPA: oxidoreductase, partial [Pseudomonas sp.]|nr:oxidoreductase [Pseudomonas sp.]